MVFKSLPMPGKNKQHVAQPSALHVEEPVISFLCCSSVGEMWSHSQRQQEDEAQGAALQLEL